MEFKADYDNNNDNDNSYLMIVIIVFLPRVEYGRVIKLEKTYIGKVP